MKIIFPVMDIRMIPMDKIVANDYNPNKVAPPEMKLQKKSIEEDGYTMPIVVYHDKDNDLSNRMASTIRHNRARGIHQIKSMSDIVLPLVHEGWDDLKIPQISYCRQPHG